MSDAITDSNRVAEKLRLDAINHKKHAERMKELYPLVKEYKRNRTDLIALGYRVDEMENLRIWKEI